MHLPILSAADGAGADAITEAVQQLENAEPQEVASKLKDALRDFFPRFGHACLVYLIGYFLLRALIWLLRKLLARSKIDPTLHSFILSAVRISLYILLIMTCLGVLDVPLTPLITALGATGLALSLAVKDTLSNIAGGISVLFSRPFRKGDFVEIASTAGTVREIGLVYTQLRTADNKHVYLPNGDVSKATIVNYTQEQNRRLEVVFSLRAGSDVDTAQKIIRDAIAGCPMALDDPAPIVRVTDHSYALIKISCYVWAAKDEIAELKAYLIATVRLRLRQAGLEPEPQEP